MRFPSWPDFKNGLGKFEQKVADFKKEHPDWDRVINGAITFLPPPFDALADKIYNSFDGSGEEKANAVLSYLQHLESLEEKHYNQIALQLDNLLIEINDVKQITAKESTLQTIQEILISSGKETNQKLDQLNNDLKQIGVKVDRIEEIANKDLIVDQDTNQRVRELESKFAYLVQINEERFTQHNITTAIKQGEDKQIPQSFLIELEQRNKEIEQLRAELTKLKYEPEFDIEYTLKTANAYYYDKKYYKAIELYDQILKVEPKNVYALNNKGLVLGNLGKFEEEISYYDKALEIDPKYISALNNKGVALGNLGRYEEAMLWYDKMLQIDPKRFDALNNKGLALIRLGRYEEAISYYDKILEINPTYVYALKNKSFALDMLGK